MHCPICHKQVSDRNNPYRPFCSERCKLVDLDNWLSGRYRIPADGHDQQGPELSETAADLGAWPPGRERRKVQ
jgi:uncharacterized protein